MPINTNLNQSPYFDDYDQDKQFNRILFKPGFAVQARELTQLQSILQNQIEQFGDNIFKEGSIVKGATFTNINDLRYVKLRNVDGTFNPLAYVSRVEIESPGVDDIEVDYVYVMEGSRSGLQAQILAAVNGPNQSSQVPPPTFWIKYLNTQPGYTQFDAEEAFTITLTKFKRGTLNPLSGAGVVFNGGDSVATVAAGSGRVGKAFGIQSSPGVIFQKGHFIFAAEQILIVENYSDVPTDKNVGYRVLESKINALQDDSLYDNAFGSKNENAPGADRLKLTPQLVVKTPTEAKEDADFFTLVRYQNGNAVTLRDVSQYNVLGEELARRTYEESGNYVLEQFPVSSDDRIPQGETESKVHALVGQGTAYVKGFRVENSGERSFEIDPISTTDTQENQSVATDYGYYVKITGTVGRVDIDYTPVTLQDSGNSTIGQALAINITPDRLYLSNIQMSGSIANLAKVTDGNGSIEVENRLQEVTGKPLIFDTGLISLFGTSDTLIPVRATVTATPSSGAITITANPGEDFDCQNDDIFVVTTGTNDHKPLDPNIPVTKTNNNSELNFTLTDTSAPQVQVYFNKRLIGSNGIQPYDKVVRQPWVKVSYSGNATPANTRYSLGFPDVFEIEEIKTLGTGPGGIDEDFTNSFRLKRNQKDQFYDISYIEHIEGRPKPADGAQNLYIKMKVFEVSNATGEYFFSINSYPNTLDRNDIPVHVSDTGIRYNLRDCFDFRPHVDKDGAADYNASTSGSAPHITTAVGTIPTFTSLGAPLIPALSSGITTDIEYYLTRVDTIVCDSYGDLSLVKGTEAQYAIPAKIENDKLAIATVSVPGFPALSAKDADRQQKREYAIRMTPTGIKNYTMKDLHSLEKKIDNMAYYISLNQLEAETQNLTVLDENGLNRFKNGFVVDPFNDLSLAQIDSPEFKAAVPFNQKILTPALKTFPLDLKYKSNTSSTVFPSVNNPKVVSLTKDSNVDIITQPYASSFRNCVSNFYKYVGEGVISPPYDAAYDTTVNPVTLEIDLATPFNEFVDNIQQFIPMTDRVVREELIADERAGGRGRWRRRDRIQTFRQTITTSNLTVDETVINAPVGEFVSNFQFEPFMASRDVKIYMSGLRPDTPHYFFFDGVDVNAHIIPGTPDATNVDDIERFGDMGVTSLSSDSNGIIRAVFRVPAETFYVGDRVLEIVDVDQYASIDSASTSKGFVTYRAYNFSVEKSALTTSTRAPTFDVNQTTTTRNVARRVPGRDPIAQTFFIKKGMGAGSNSVFLSEVDVFFKRVSADNGITLQIREVINGFPTNQIVPFSKVHKLPAALTSSASDDASVATTFTFEAPVRLDVEKEYAVVLQPDASDPNYLVFISKVGETDLTPGASQGSAIVQDWGDGVLFSSTNNSAWNSYQDEDMKFTLKRHNFSASTGTVTLTSNDSEFLTITDINGTHIPGETIYQEKTLIGNTGATISINQNSKTLTGTDLSDTYANGDFIKITQGSDYGVFQIATVDNATTIQLTSAWPYANTTGASHLPVVVGDLAYYDFRNPNDIHLEKSSANSTRPFTTGQIIGLDSEVTATITSINNINMSYFQPMIMKANDSVSKTTLSGTFVPPSNVNITYNTPLAFNDNNHFNEQGVVLYSKSNDPSGAKAFDLIINMENGSNQTSSPMIDVEVSKLIGYQYTLANTSADTSKYISKIVELNSDLDAEDIHVIVTGYKPRNSDIKVFIKAQNAFDHSQFDLLDWTELEVFEGVGVESSVNNIRDYREFKYRIPATAKVGGLPSGAFEYTSSNGTFSEFRRFAIKIELHSDNIHNAPTLRDYRAIALT